jgi:hypothetical protein
VGGGDPSVNGNGAAAAAGPVPGQEMNLASVLPTIGMEAVGEGQE